MLPLVLLRSSTAHPVLVELKNGETYNGHMVQCDTWMNIHLREVICTSKDGDRFWRMPEAYIRGNTIKYLRVPDEVLDKAKEAEAQMKRDGAEMALCSFAAATGLSLGNAKETEAQMKRDEKRPAGGGRGRGGRGGGRGGVGSEGRGRGGRGEGGRGGRGGEGGRGGPGRG